MTLRDYLRWLDGEGDYGDLSAARGMLYGVLLSLPVWALILAVLTILL